MSYYYHMNHRARIEIATRVKKMVLRKYRKDILGIAIYGSVAKQEDRKYSDLEIFAVTKKKLAVRERRYIYKNMPIEISYIPEREMLRKARQVTPDWPIVADFYRSYRILYDNVDWFRKLERAVASQNKDDFKNAIEKSMVWLCELIGKIKNAYFCRDSSLFLYLASHFGWESAIFLGLINRSYYHSERSILKKVFDFPILPPNYRYLLKTVCRFSAAPRETIYQATMKLFHELNELADQQGVVLNQKQLFI